MFGFCLIMSHFTYDFVLIDWWKQNFILFKVFPTHIQFKHIPRKHIT